MPQLERDDVFHVLTHPRHETFDEADIFIINLLL